MFHFGGGSWLPRQELQVGQACGLPAFRAIHTTGPGVRSARKTDSLGPVFSSRSDGVQGCSFAAVRGMALTVIQSRRIRLFLILPILSAFPSFVRPLCPALSPADRSDACGFSYFCDCFLWQQLPAVCVVSIGISHLFCIWQSTVGYNKNHFNKKSSFSHGYVSPLGKRTLFITAI